MTACLQVSCPLSIPLILVAASHPDTQSSSTSHACIHNHNELSPKVRLVVPEKVATRLHTCKLQNETDEKMFFLFFQYLVSPIV